MNQNNDEGLYIDCEDMEKKELDHYMKVAELHKKVFADDRPVEEIAQEYMDQVLEMKGKR